MRLLILGGTPACGLHERGVSLSGGWIEGELDLRFCTARGQTVLAACHFADRPVFFQSSLQLLSLYGSHLPGLLVQGATVSGSFFPSKVTATGKVDVAGAKIGGQLDCEGASFDGTGGTALKAQGATVTGGLFFRNLLAVAGCVDLTSAHVGALADDRKSWPLGAGDLILDGFTYDRITGTGAPVAFAARREWLEVGAVWQGDFRPQPYGQLARVLRQMGHEGEARKVLIERERLLAANLLATDRANYLRAVSGGPEDRGDAGWIWLRMTGTRLWSGLTRRVAGYGYAPQYALYWSLAVVTLSFFAYVLFWQMGAMVPGAAIVLTSADWARAVGEDASAPALVWAGPAAAHYETFYSLAYALDVYLPVVDLGQHSTWSATTVTWWGWSARLYTWALQAAGYVITSLGLAAATGIIQRNQPD